MNFFVKSIVYGAIAYGLLITACVLAGWVVGLYITAVFLVCDAISLLVIRRRLRNG